jgi:hypothetical protein
LSNCGFGDGLNVTDPEKSLKIRLAFPRDAKGLFGEAPLKSWTSGELVGGAAPPAKLVVLPTREEKD